MLQKEAIWSRFKIYTQSIGFTESKASREFKCVSGEDVPNSSITSLVGDLEFRKWATMCKYTSW